jgi:hypothetical protein
MDHRHRDTLERIFSHASSGNLEWRQVESLLDALGAQHLHNGKLEVTLGPETEVFRPPHGKDVEEQTLVDLRRLLRDAGYAPENQ